MTILNNYNGAKYVNKSYAKTVYLKKLKSV